eukprot:scaffold125633_cov63-Phaeocystis_antarctica.AAC.3
MRLTPCCSKLYYSPLLTRRWALFCSADRTRTNTPAATLPPMRMNVAISFPRVCVRNFPSVYFKGSLGMWIMCKCEPVYRRRNSVEWWCQRNIHTPAPKNWARPRNSHTYSGGAPHASLPAGQAAISQPRQWLSTVLSVRSGCRNFAAASMRAAAMPACSLAVFQSPADTASYTPGSVFGA